MTINAGAIHHPHFRKGSPVTKEVVIDVKPRRIIWPELQEQFAELIVHIWRLEKAAR